ncbi:MAG: limonene-1,2-epoxide hydrolase family protein, partial [Mycobacterium sp.]
MTDEALTTPATTTTANARTVETFLFAMADEDFDTVESLAAPDLIWQNVGVPSIRGRDRVMKLLRRGEGKMGFAVKFHRIAQ